MGEWLQVILQFALAVILAMGVFIVNGFRKSVEKLEKCVETMDERLDKISTDLAELRGSYYAGLGDRRTKEEPRTPDRRDVVSRGI